MKDHCMSIEPIAYFHSPFGGKFGIPRQSGIATEVEGTIVFTPKYRSTESLRGIESFTYLWLIWGFSENEHTRKVPTVRPPLLGGNTRLGVWATRSPFRPNNLGLSSVRISGVERDTADGLVIKVKGADLMDGTPIYDIKPYLEYVDSHKDAGNGFANPEKWRTLEVVIPENVEAMFSADELKGLRQILEQDPRPQYQDDPQRVYGMTYAGREIHFRVRGGVLCVE